MKEQPVRFQHPSNLHERAGQIVDALQGERRGDEIEAFGGERQRLLVADETSPRPGAERFTKRAGADDLRRRPASVPSAAATWGPGVPRSSAVSKLRVTVARRSVTSSAKRASRKSAPPPSARAPVARAAARDRKPAAVSESGADIARLWRAERVRVKVVASARRQAAPGRLFRAARAAGAGVQGCGSGQIGSAPRFQKTVRT